MAMPDRMEKTRNFHVPLPEPLYQQLRQEAERQGQPATALTRVALETWLREERRKAVAANLKAFAEDAAGTALDLDPVLEAEGAQRLAHSEWGGEVSETFHETW